MLTFGRGARRYGIAAAVQVITLMAIPTHTVAQEIALPFTITPVTEQLYLVDAGSARTVFLVTESGIVLVDPLSNSVAQVCRRR